MTSHGLALAGERGDRVEDQAVIGPVEIRRAHHVRDLVPGAGVEQQATEHGLLGFDRMRWSADLGEGVPGRVVLVC